MLVRVMGVGLVLMVATALTAAPGEKQGDPLSGKRFKSVDKLEMGLGPNGVVKGHWSITFKDGKYSWRWSDVSTAGRYQIDAATGKITASGFKMEIEGEYDAKTGSLTWNKVKYQEEKEEKKEGK
jgi:hypothetical protein